MLVASFAAVALVGCGFYDPTEATFYVRVTNDTSQPVVVSACATGDGACNGHLFEPERLNPGGSLPTVQGSVGALDVELISSTTGKRLGCLPLYFNHEPSGVTVHVSEMIPYQKTYPVR